MRLNRNTKALRYAVFQRGFGPNLSGGLGPVLRTVVDAGDFDGVLLDLVDGDIRQGRKHQLAPPFHASGASKVGKVLQCLAAVIDGFDHLAGGGRIVFLDALEYTLQVFGGGC